MTAGWLLLPALVLPAAPIAAATTLGPSAGLTAAAAASGRPPECMAGSRRALARGPSVWQAARVPNLVHYCDLMARAHTELGTQPEAAMASAKEADVALPGRAAPEVVIARAALALGALDEAAKAFEKARSLDARSVEDPSTMHDLARVLARTGKRDEALTVYRALVPRVDLLGTADRRVAVLLEAAHVSMAAEGAGTATLPSEVGKKVQRARLDEAVAYLREARGRPATQQAADVMLSLVLALDRAGSHEEADAALAEAQRSGFTDRWMAAVGAAGGARKSGVEYLAAPEDGLALTGLAAEGGDKAAAQKAWEAFLAGNGGKGPWAGAAKARLEAVKKGGGGKAVKAAPAKGAKAPKGH